LGSAGAFMEGVKYGVLPCEVRCMNWIMVRAP